LSVNYAAANHSVSFQIDSTVVDLKSIADTSFELSVNNAVVGRTGKIIKKGIASWDIMKDDY
jgi:hypothetical protein